MPNVKAGSKLLMEWWGDVIFFSWKMRHKHHPIVKSQTGCQYPRDRRNVQVPRNGNIPISLLQSKTGGHPKMRRP
jgi:hypothetical protein